MTGMIHSGRQGEACPGCGRTTTLQDWTCPQCGGILDRYLFGTVTQKSVKGADKDAFAAGNEACMTQWKKTGSAELGVYSPVPGHETAYRAGWQFAADKIEAKGERKRGRRRGLQLLAAGAVITLIGGSLTLTWGSFAGDIGRFDLVILGAGLLNIVLGVFALITGNSDAVPPPPPGTSAEASLPEEPESLVAPSRILPQLVPSGLQAETGAGIVTWTLIGLNIAVFLAMLVAGVNIINPSVDSLVRWGADFAPRTTEGEWWRLITSMFLHVGVLHIAFNMIALMQVGPLMERLLGKMGFTLTYFIAGLAGGVASLFWNPYLVSAGASGAIFGLYGALLGYLSRQPKALPSETTARLMTGSLAFVGYNVIYGLTNPQIDMAAHVGGLVSGLICGFVLSLPATEENFRRRRVRRATLAAAAAIALIATAANLPHAVDLQAHVKRLDALERSTTAKVNDALSQFRVGKIKAADFTDVMDRRAISDWTAERDVLAKLRGLPPRQARVIEIVVQYMELRRDAWLALAAGIKDGKMDKMKEAADKGRQANEQLMELARLGKNR